MPVHFSKDSVRIASLTTISLICVWISNAIADQHQVDFECRWTDEEITIDGVAEEGVWQHAQLIDDFYLPWLRKEPRPAITATRARLLWDRQYIYYFADMDDQDLFADIKEHDGQTWNNDVFELFFKPADDKPGYYEFHTSAAGTVMDMFIPQRGDDIFKRYKGDGEFHITAKVQRRGTLNARQDTDKGWSVEGRVPWIDFLRSGGRPNVDEEWKFALCRYDYSVDSEEPELSTCAPLSSKDRADFHRYEDYATLRFVGPSERHGARPFGIKRRAALTTSRVIGSPDPPPPYRARRVFDKFKLSFPIFVVNEPGSQHLLFIDQSKSYGKTRMCRTSDALASGEFETLWDFEDAAYSIVFHPEFTKNGFIYVGENSAEQDGPKKTRIVRYTLDREPQSQIKPDSRQTIIEWESDGHNGGAMAFGHDGMLYITSGDGTSDSDTNLRGQDLSKLTAKVLRIDVNHTDDDEKYSIPKDNPFVKVQGARPETWAYGLRNPWRMTVDPKTGNLWVGNNGQDLWEQVYLVERGANYGWSVYEGGHPFYLTRTLGPTPAVKPTFDHPHSEARSLTGGVVYYGRKLPELHGAYIYGDYSTGKIWGAKVDGKNVVWHKELADTTLQISSFGLDPDGELLITDHQGNNKGGFYSLEVVEKEHVAANEFPRRLSDSGLFRSVTSHEVQPALIPYSVNSPLWSDGAIKHRYIALPDAESKIDLKATGSWSFPDETVLVKSFALETEEGEPKSRKWIETRFLLKQQGEWTGYSYQWNDEQTDAILVAKDGANKEFRIHTSDGHRTQMWHFPSRTECMVCHSRAAKFVLGLSTAQLNKVHDYDGVSDNQLRTFENLAVWRVDWRSEAVLDIPRQLREYGVAEDEIKKQTAKLTSNRGQRAAVATSMLTKRPAQYDKLPNPYDNRLDVNLRARSYLHANCAQCHVGAGGGNSQIDLLFTSSLDKMKLIDQKPLHHTFGIPEARLVSPGEPDRSVLLHRVATRDRGKMPQLATSVVDDKAVELLTEWIKLLRK